MMKAGQGRALFVLLFAGLFIGCDETVDHYSDGPLYVAPTTPENLIANLQTFYRNREIEFYAPLLAPEFKFKFQPIDGNVIGTPFWTRDQDSTGTRALLTTTEVSEIRINLSYGNRDVTIDRSAPVDSVKIRVITTDLQVDQTDGTTWVVTDQQDLFFRQGKAGNSQDPTHWFIYEWDDLPSLGSAPEMTYLASSGLAGRGTTWGGLKALYTH